MICFHRIQSLNIVLSHFHLYLCKVKGCPLYHACTHVDHIFLVSVLNRDSYPRTICGPCRALLTLHTILAIGLNLELAHLVHDCKSHANVKFHSWSESAKAIRVQSEIITIFKQSSHNPSQQCVKECKLSNLKCCLDFEHIVQFHHKIYILR